MRATPQVSPGALGVWRSFALRAAVAYAAMGALWITYSDRLLADLFADPAMLTQYQTLKGWLFVAATAFLLYLLLRLNAPDEVGAAPRESQVKGRGWRLRVQLLGLALVIVAPLVALLGYNLYLDARQDQRQAGKSALHLARIAAQDTESFLADARRMLETLAQRPAVRALDRKACDPLLASLPKLQPRFRNALTVNRDGDLVCSAVAPAPGTPSRPDPAYWFNRVRDSMQFTIGTPGLGFITRRWVVTLAYPLRDARGAFVGAVGLPVDLVDYPVLPTTEGLPQGAMVGVASYAGTAIARSHDAQAFVGRSTRDSPVRAAALAAKTGQIEMTGLDGVRRIYGYTPIAGSDWYAIAGIPAAAVYAESRARLLSSILLAVAVLLLVAVGAYAAGRRIEQPLRRIEAAARAVTAGDRASRAPLAGSRETIALATGFNAMLDALEASERRFRETMDNVHLIAVALDERGNVTYCNDFLLGLSGWRREELLGRNWFDTMLPDPGPVRAMFEQALGDGKLPLHHENEIVTRRGERRLIRWNNTILHDAAARILGTVSLGEDITQRKRAEAVIEAKTDLLRDTFENIGQGISLVDRDLRLVGWNRRFLEMLDFPEWLVHEGTRAEDILRFNALRGEYGPGDPEELVRIRLETMRRPDGHYEERVRPDGTVLELRGTRLPGGGMVTTYTDITRRKRGEEEILRIQRELRESEQNYRHLFEVNPHPMWVYELKTLRFLAVNDAAVSHYGYGRDEFLAMTIADIRPPEDLPRLLQNIAQVTNHAIDKASYWRHRKKDGTLIDVEITSHVLDFQGRQAEIVLAHDVTERRRAETQLRLAASVFDHAQEGIVIADADANIVTVNSRFTEITGYSAEEVIGRNPRILKSGRHDAQFYRAMWTSVRTNGSWTGEIWNRRKDGGIYPEWLSISAVRDSAEKVLNYVAVFADVTQRVATEQALRISEDRFRQAFYLSPDSININRLEDGLYVAINKGFTQITGYTEAEIIGHSSIEFDIWCDLEDRAALINGLKKNGSVENLEARFRAKDGTIIDGLMSAAVIDIDGMPHSINITRDMTERKRVASEILRLNAELERRIEERTRALQVANRELEAFSYSVSHDLRAPLRAINGFAQLIEDGHAAHLGEDGRELLARVRAGATRMGHLIDDLLNLAQISRQAMHVRRVDLSSLAQEVADELQAVEPGRRAEWVIAPDATAEGDPGLLRVALQNLMGNAWKYSARRDGARIEFGVVERQGRPEYFVRDNGAGFDMAYAAKLFGAFQRLHTPSEFPGTGIGLATVARIIHRHGGEVRAEGRVDEGASFYFTLGLAGAQDQGREDRAA